MKVVFFCGGMGLRIREHSSRVPKPMIPVGERPLLWHSMKYFAAHGHNEFILCLGYKADVIKRWFLEHDETFTNDFVMSGRDGVELFDRDSSEWKITFVDTGLHASIGQRLRQVQRHLGDDEHFIAHYGDVLTDAPLDAMVDNVVRRDKTASLLMVQPNLTFHTIHTDEDGVVTGIQEAREAGIWINGGMFVLRRDIFDYLLPGEDLVEEPFRRLVDKEELIAWRYTGFWAPMDTLKEKMVLDELYEAGTAPWMIWNKRDV